MAPIDSTTPPLPVPKGKLDAGEIATALLGVLTVVLPKATAAYDAGPTDAPKAIRDILVLEAVLPDVRKIVEQLIADSKD